METVDSVGAHPARANGPGARVLVLVVLCCGLVGRLADANPHASAAYVPFVLVLYVVPLWYASGRGRAILMRHRAELLVVQAVLTYVPFAVFGPGWVGGVSGLLGALVLLLLPPRPAWAVFGVLTVAEPMVWLVVGLPYQQPVNAVFWVTNAFVVTALSGYALNRLVDLDHALAATQERLVADAVNRQKLAAAEHLRTRIVRRLAELSACASEVVRSTDPDRIRSGLATAGRLAREAAADSRRLLLELPDPMPGGTPVQEGAPIVTPRLAYLVTVVVTGLFGMQTILNVVVPPPGGELSPRSVAVVVLVVLAVVALTLRHLDLDGSARRPAAWPLSLAVHGALLGVLYVVAGTTALALLATFAASVLVLGTHRARWAVLAVVVAIMPVLTLAHPPADATTLQEQVLWCIYFVAVQTTASLLMFGLSRFTVASLAFERALHHVAGAAATQEQARLARDAHDTLGLGLSTIALKSDLAAELLDAVPDRARREAVQIMRLASTVSNDALALGNGALVLDLGHELASARATLEAAGVRVEVEVPEANGPVDGEAILAAVLREAVTNVIRHSRARFCAIQLAQTDADRLLHVRNDGAQTRRHDEGSGLRNIEQRLRPLGGRLTVSSESGVFALTATLPRISAPAVNR